MSQPSGADLFYYSLILILPVSALFAQRLPVGQMLKMAAGWIAIFGILLIIVGQKERFRPLWEGAVSTLTGEDQTVTGGIVRIPMAADGHFYANVRINGVQRRLLIDSGATVTALSATTAQAVGVSTDENFPNTVVNTANGQVTASRAVVAEMQVGDIVARDLPVMVAAEFGDTDVIGMNFLSRLRAWRVEGRTLILEPQPI